MRNLIAVIASLFLATACYAGTPTVTDIKKNVAAVDCTDAAKAEPKAQAVAKEIKDFETSLNAAKVNKDVLNLVGIAVNDGDLLVKYTKSPGQCKLQVKMMTRNLDNIEKLLGTK